MKKLLLIGLFLTSGLFASIGSIMAVKGDALVQRADSSSVDAKAGFSLEEGDIIVTQKRSRVQVMLKDETVVTIGSKSRFSFDEYAFDGANSKVAMSSTRGFFRSVTGKIGKLAPQRFKVKTASATIGIRGTDFWGTTGGDTERFTCNSGKIIVTFEGGEREIEAGRFLEVSSAGVIEGDQGSDDGQSEDEADEKDSGDEESSADESSASKGAKLLEAVVSVDGQKVSIRVEDIADVVQGVESSEAFSIDIGAEDREILY